jgi:hypothetical protein
MVRRDRQAKGPERFGESHTAGIEAHRLEGRCLAPLFRFGKFLA